MANVILTKPVRHNGEIMKPDDVLTDMSMAEAERLVRLGVGYIDDDVLPDDDDLGGGGDELQDAAALQKLSKAELVALASDKEIALSGKESKADLVKLLLDADTDSNDVSPAKE